ncbi:ferritin-like domain-containing protein [Sphingomonas aurantiaca]|uniref:ferritin-like domain-containing protein n=1 Tax=Sphingomonas aurantiaca TaxID=185949 RepID=UPI00335B40C7
MDGKADVAATISREKLMHSLYEAAELEHNLMCTYLYAAFSLKDGSEEGLSEREADAVRRWRRAIIDVAIDEMGHLVAVWNITASLGGSPRFGRTNFPLDAGYLPAGVVVKLAPFSESVLQHFVHLERPHGSAEPDGSGFAPELNATRTPRQLRLTPAAFDYETVGIFYETMAANLRKMVESHGESETFCGAPALQLSTTEVDLGGAKVVTDLSSALAAFDAIIVEGEGAPTETAASHYQRFVRIREEFAEMRTANPNFAPAFPSAHNPVLRKPPRPEGRVWLEDPAAVAVVDLANATYGLTLRLLAASYVLPSPSPEKTLYVDVAISLMRALTPLAEHAARLPAGPSNPDCNAGISFTALREAAPLPPGSSARRFYVERLAEIAAVADTMAGGAPRIGQAARVLQSLHERLRDAPDPAETAHMAEANGPQASEGQSSLAPPSPASRIADGVDVVEGREIEISYDGKRCIHARFCVTGAPRTFLANVDGPWIFPDATDYEELSAIVRNCPSGALHYRRKDGHDEKAPPVNLMALREDGPYAARAEIVLDGSPAGFRATLCRCGASKNKPFCDKSHKYVGFKASGEPKTRKTPLLTTRDGPLDIRPELDGPLQIRGNLEIISGTGRTVACLQSARLCRCGGSATKPFCDNTHKAIGFKSD